MLAHLTRAKLKKLACTHIIVQNFGMCMWASEHRLHTRDTCYERVLYEPCTLHMWCSYRRCRQYITDQVLYTVSLEIPNK